MDEIIKLYEEKLNRIIAEEWKRRYNHVLKIENEDLIENIIDKFIINWGELSIVTTVIVTVHRRKKIGPMSGVEVLSESD